MAKQKPRADKADLAVYRRLISYARPYTGRLILGLVFGIFFGASHGGILVGLKKFFNFDAVTLGMTEATGVVTLLLVVGFIWAVGGFLSKYLMVWVGLKVVMDLRVKTYNHIQDLSMAYFSQSRTGELISRTTNDTALVERSVSNVLADLVREPFTLLAAMVFMFVELDHMMVLVSLLVFPICIVPITLFGRRVRRMSREGQEKMGDLVSRIHETIAGIRIVKSFCMEGDEKKRFWDLARAVFRRNLGVSVARAALENLIVFLAIVGLCLVFLYAAHVGKGLGELITFAGALFIMYRPVKKLSNVGMVIQQSAAAADRIFEILDTPIDVGEEQGAVDLGKPVKDIVFNDVSFSYGQAPVLNGIDLKIKQGEFVAIVGPSGGGKTTLLSLLPRFYDPASGAVEINGKDIRGYTHKSLRGEIGIVTQDTVLFNNTIANNICYGCGEVREDEMIAVAKKAHAHHFILEQGGYGREIGELGSNLSGGQRQRLAIARALMKDPSILIFDEATSSLDTESEEQIQKAMEEIRKERTVLVIAHRLSTVQHADRIVVLVNGRVEEQGTHKELMGRDGTYRKLYETSLG